MQNLPAQPIYQATTPQPIQVVKPSSNRLIIILPIIIFLISALAGFFISKNFIPPVRPKPQGYPFTDITNLPVKFELLQNSILSNWSAHVQGKIATKSQDSFTLKPITIEYTATGSAVVKEIGSSNSLKIIYIPGKTTFKQNIAATQTEAKLTEVNFSDIPLESVVNGTIESYQPGRDQRTVIGKKFVIQ